MEAIRYELMDKKISITTVCPGPVKTNVSYNALSGDGSKFGRMDTLIENGMPVERCAELILVATCNKVKEGWISKHPALLAAYLAQYFPSLFFILMKRKANATKPDFAKKEQ